MFVGVSVGPSLLDRRAKVKRLALTRRARFKRLALARCANVKRLAAELWYAS